MELTFFCPADSAIIFNDQAQNRGIEAVPALLHELERRGITVRRVDLSTTPEHERFTEYSKACWPAVSKRYEVKRMFGTNRQSALFFGLQVPALLVKESGEMVSDTYPHRERPNTIVTIYDFLTKALANFRIEPRLGE